MSKLGGGLLVVLLLTGCSSLPQSKQVHNYDTLAGSGPTMSDKAGLFSGSQKDNYNGGTLVYSTDKSKKSLVHTPTQAERKQSAGAGASQNSGASAVSTTASASGTTASNRAPGSSMQATEASRSDFQQFEQYQQFKKFEQSSPNSTQRQKFHEWQEWKQYQQWRKNGGGQ